MKKTLPLYFLIGLFLMLGSSTMYAQTPTNSLEVKASKAIYLGQTLPYNEVAHLEVLPNNDKKNSKKANFPKIVDNFHGASAMPIVKTDARPLEADPLRKLKNPLAEGGGLLEIEVLVNVDGIHGGQSGAIPPDPVGHINDEYFVQMTNAGGGALMFVLDKDGNTVSNPVSLQFVWSQLNVGSNGDPIVLWDQAAERWVICELGGGLSSFVFAVSVTSDPLGAYNAYQIFSVDGEIPDYPKFGIWNDAYYLTTNEPSKPDIPTYVINRDAVLNGSTTADFQIVSTPKFNAPGTFQVMTAADWDGALPPPEGSPQYFTRIHDDAWGFGEDRIEVWSIDVDFDNPANTILNGPLMLATAAFNSTLCAGGNIFNCIDQGNGSLVSALQHVIMYRTQYRNFGTHESMVLNFSVNVNNSTNQAGVRWIELRKTEGEDWSIYQEGTYAPDDMDRFMGSIAMDGSGNIALAYSVMGGESFPSLRVTGRRVSDPLGEMTFDELEFASGQSYNMFSRWGDYSAMSVDPTDERTFWFTGEYMGPNGQWRTKILSFLLARDTNDIRALNVVTPENSAFLGNAETVTATFLNNGLETQSNFEVGYMVDGNLIDTEMVTQNLMPDSTIEVTFSATADMSIIKDYEFKVFSALVGDQNMLNDTFRTIITKLPRFDAAVTSFPGIETPVCEDNTMIGIEVTNVGVEVLNSVTVIWSYNGGAEEMIDWTGTLASGETTIIPIALSGLVNGMNTITARTEKPNGLDDETMSNDELSRPFNAFLIDPHFLTLEINLDNSPQEVTWELTNEDGIRIFNGGPYMLSQAGTQVTEQLCIVDGCYTFTMFDSGNDGLCCASGQGSYRLSDENEVYLAQGDNYGSEEATEFCFPFTCFIDATVNVLNEAAPGVNNGVIFLSAVNATGSVMYSIDGGMTFMTNGLFPGLSGGIYNVVVKDESNCTIAFDVLVGTCTIDYTADIVGVSSIGAADGSITINPVGGVPPLEYSIDGGSTSQADPFFPNLAFGSYTIEVRDSINCVKSLIVQVDELTDIEELSVGQSVKISPNPTEGIFYLEANGPDDVWTIDTEIIDASGRVIQRGTLARFDDTFSGRMSLYLYPSGIYFVRLLHPDFKQLYRIVRH